MIRSIRTNLREKKINRAIIITLALSFVIPVILSAASYYMQNIYPGSNETILIYDMFYQYTAFYASLRNMFTGGNSLHFNWSCALGGNYIGLYSYYLSSPITWLLALCPLESLPDGVYYTTLLRFGLCGLSMSSFLLFAPMEKTDALIHRKETNSDGIHNNSWHYLGVLLFSTCYALMSYMYMNGISPMWIDVVILAPIVVWGLELLIDGNIWLYAISVCLCLFCNYYIAYMVIIFGGLFFLGLLYVEWERVYPNFKRILVRYIIGNIAAVGLDAPFLLTTVKVLGAGKGTDDSNVISELFRHEHLDIIKQLLPQQYDTIETGGLPSIFCGTVILLLAIIYFAVNKNVKEKRFCLAMLLILYVSFLTLPIDRLWHGFAEPVCYPHRYSFLWSFMILYCAYRGYNLILNMQFKRKGLFIIIMSIYTAIELLLNGASHIAEHNIRYNYAYRYRYDSAIDLTKNIREIIDRNGARPLDRMDRHNSLTHNDPLLFNYHGLAYFSSTYNRSLLKLCRNMGMSQMHYKISMNGGSPVTDSLFGISYVFDATDVSDLYIRLHDKYLIYENPFSLDMGVVTVGGIDNGTILETLEDAKNPFEYQNVIASALANNETKLFEECKVSIETNNNGALYDRLEELGIAEASQLKDNEAEIVANVNCDGPLYLSIDFTDDELAELYQLGKASIERSEAAEAFEDVMQGDFELNVNGENVVLVPDRIYHPYNIYLGDHRTGDTVTVRIAGYTYPRDIYVYSLNEDKLKSWYHKLEDRKITIKDDVDATNSGFLNAIMTTMRGNKIFEGEVASDGGTLMITLPYDSGYSVYIDGNKVTTSSLFDVFLSTDVSAGNHSIRVEYVSPGWNPGLLIWIMTVIGIVGFIVIANMHKKNIRFLDEVL